MQIMGAYLQWRRRGSSLSILVASLFVVFSIMAFLPSAKSDMAPSFLTKPSNKTIKSGMNVDFKCKATGVPPPTIEWFNKGVRIIPFMMLRHFIGKTFKTLYIIPVYWSDAGQITCEASNSVGTISAHAYLRVVARTPPTWTNIPQNITLYKGQRITIQCRADGYPEPSYTWNKGASLAENDPSIMARPDGGLIFLTASLSHRGTYTCTARNQAGSISKSIYVNVLEDPSIIRDPKDALGVVGQVLSLQCIIIGNPAIKVSWEKDGNALDIQGDNQKVVDVQQWDKSSKLYTLKINQARASDAGKYKCVVVNGNVRKASKEAVVSFTGMSSPPKVKVPHPIRKVAKASDAILKCIFTGTPLPQVVWFKYFAKTRIELKKTLVTLSKEAVEASLILDSISQTDKGTYFCQGKNNAGVVTGNVTLIVPADPRRPEAVIAQSEFPGIRDNNVTLKCMFTGNPQPEVAWYKVNNEIADGLGQTVPGHNNTYIATLRITDVQYTDAGRYLCRGQNPYGKAEMNVTLTVKGRPMPPNTLLVETKSRTLMFVSWTPGITGGLPVSYTIEYKHSDTYFWTEVSAGRNTSKALNNDDGWHEILLRVRASNSYGSSKPSEVFFVEGIKNVTVVKNTTLVKNTSSPERSVGGGALVVGGAVGGGVIFLILLILVFVVLWRKRVSQSKLTRRSGTAQSVLYTRSHHEEEELLDNSALPYSYVPVSGDGAALQRQPSAEENQYQTVAKPATWEVPKRCLTMSKQLGTGHFGKVIQASMKTEDGLKTVAVKMLKENADAHHKKEFLAELELMKSMNPHPNIVGLVGSCTKGDNHYIIVEYCALGNLQELLRKSQGNRVYSNLAGGSVSLTSRDLLSFMWQVARGMSYLASLKLVHRDIAARNILVDTGNICKIADFGLARDIYEDNQYLKTTEGELPLRWMALESIFQGITTTESDVWSFGVLMWEIITLGAKPYPGFTREQLISNLHLGYRMPRPPYCKEELYAVIWQCWQKEPSERPNFSMLCRTLNRMLAAEKVLIDLDNLDASYINANNSGEPISPTAKTC